MNQGKEMSELTFNVPCISKSCNEIEIKLIEGF